MPSAIDFSELCDMRELWRRAIFQAPLPLSRALSRIDSGEQDEDDWQVATLWGLASRRKLQNDQNTAARTIPGWLPSREMREDEAFVGDVLLRADLGRCRRN